MFKWELIEILFQGLSLLISGRFPWPKPPPAYLGVNTAIYHCIMYSPDLSWAMGNSQIRENGSINSSRSVVLSPACQGAFQDESGGEEHAFLSWQILAYGREELNPCLAEQAQLQDQPVDLMLQPSQTSPWEHLLGFTPQKGSVPGNDNHNSGKVASLRSQGSQGTVTLFTTSLTYSFFHPGEAEPWEAT